MGRRNDREDMVVAVLARAGWDRNARAVPGAVRGYEETYRLGYVSPGTGEGRGTTLIDAFRSRAVGRAIRLDMLAVKGSSLETHRGEPKLPSYAILCTGAGSTLRAVIAACQAGAPLPVLHFASTTEADGSPARKGWVLAYDAAGLIRAAGDLSCRPHPPGHKWGRGRMPALSVGMSPPIKSGGRYVRHVPGWSPDGDWTYAASATTVSYPRIAVGYLAAGLNNNWRPCDVGDIPDIIEAGFDWRAGEGVSVYT
jgi:hypothetical protein